MSGKKYTLYLGGRDVDAKDVDANLIPLSDKNQNMKKEEEPMSKISTDTPQVNSPKTEKTSPTVAPPEVEAVYKSFSDFLQSDDIKKFETLKPIPDLGINGFPITEKQVKLLYEFNPFLATALLPNDEETRQEYDLDNDEFKNISVGDFLTKQYLNSVRQLDNNFFKSLLKDDIAGLDCCSYCSVASGFSSEKNQKLPVLVQTSSTQNTDATSSTSSIQIGGTTLSELNDFFENDESQLAFREEFESPNGYKHYADLQFIDIFKIMVIMSYTETGETYKRYINKREASSVLTIVSKSQQFIYLIDKLLYSSPAIADGGQRISTSSARFLFKSYEWDDTDNPNKTAYIMTTGPTSAMLTYEVLFSFRPNATNVSDYIKEAEFEKVKDTFAPTLKSREHILKAFLLQIILFTISQGPDSDNYKALSLFVEIFIGAEYANLQHYLNVRFTDSQRSVETVDELSGDFTRTNVTDYGLQTFVTTHLDRNNIPMYLISNVTTKDHSFKEKGIFSSLSINTKLRTTSPVPLDLSEYLIVKKLDKILNLVLFQLFFGNPMKSTYYSFIMEQYGIFASQIEVSVAEEFIPIQNVISQVNVYPTEFGPPNEDNGELTTKLADNWFCYNYDSSLNDLEQMIFYKKIVPPDVVVYEPLTPLYNFHDYVGDSNSFVDMREDVYSIDNDKTETIKQRDKERKQGLGNVLDGNNKKLLDEMGEPVQSVFNKDTTLYFKNSRVKDTMQAISGVLAQLVYSSTNHVKNVSKFLKKQMMDNVNVKYILDYVDCFAEDPDYPYGYDDDTIFDDRPSNGFEFTPSKPAKPIQHRIHAWIYYDRNIKNEYSEQPTRRSARLGTAAPAPPPNGRGILNIKESNQIYLLIAVRGSKTKADWDNTDVFITSGEASNVYTIFEMHTILEEIRTKVIAHVSKLNVSLGLGNPSNKMHIYTIGHSLGGFFATTLANLCLGSDSFTSLYLEEEDKKIKFTKYAIPCVFNPFYKADKTIFSMINALPKIHIHRVRNFNSQKRSTVLLDGILTVINPVDYDDLASCYYGDYFQENYSSLPQVTLHEYSNCIMRGVPHETLDKFGYRNYNYLNPSSDVAALERFAPDSAYGHSMDNFNGAFFHCLSYRVLNNLDALQPAEFEKFQVIITSKTDKTAKNNFKYFQPVTNFLQNTIGVSTPTKNTQYDYSPNIRGYSEFYKLYGTNNGVFIYNRPTEQQLNQTPNIQDYSNEYINNLLRIVPDTLVPKGNTSPYYNLTRNKEAIQPTSIFTSLVSSITNRIRGPVYPAVVNPAESNQPPYTDFMPEFGGKRRKTIKNRVKTIKKSRRGKTRRSK
jgi:hypothetical protein